MKNQSTSKEVSNEATWKRDAFVALGAGIGAAAVMGMATFAVGRVTASEGRSLVEAILPTSRFLCSAVMTATATILALMLTLLGMTLKAEQDIDEVFYQRVKQIAFYDMIVLVTAVCFLVVHCIPITESDKIPTWWYSSVYYGLLFVSALIGGAIVSIVVLLYSTIRDIINIVGLKHPQP